MGEEFTVEPIDDVGFLFMGEFEEDAGHVLTDADVGDGWNVGAFFHKNARA